MIGHARLGDLVRRSDMELNVEWLVVGVDRNGTLTVECDVPERDRTRTVREKLRADQVVVVGRQMAMEAE